jgi:branched-chain amino acid transport system permease protein
MLDQLFSGLAIGSIYMLISLGFTLVLGIGNMVNLAHGSIVVAGMYTVYSLYTNYQISVYLGILAAIGVGAVFALGVYVLAIKPSLRNPTPDNGHRTQLVYTLLMLSFMTALFQLFFTSELLSLPFEERKAFIFLDVNIERARFVAFIIAIVVTIALYIWMQFSTLGKIVRMTGKFTESSNSIGVPVKRVFLAIFVFGGALAGLAGGLLMTVQPVAPDSSFSILIIAFIVTIAGRSSFIGVGIMGLLYGIGQVVLNARLDSHTATSVVFLAFLLVLSLDKILSAKKKVRAA